jgi:hypothetical protein
MGLVSEFKKFALRGNAVDMAVGVVIGAAFGKIVTALVGHIIMPFVGYLTSGVNLAEAAYPDLAQSYYSQPTYRWLLANLYPNVLASNIQSESPYLSRHLCVGSRQLLSRRSGC